MRYWLRGRKKSIEYAIPIKNIFLKIDAEARALAALEQENEKSLEASSEAKAEE